MIQYRYCMGIDPPRGVALWDRERREFLLIKTTNFWGVIASLDQLLIPENQVCKTTTRVYCEAPQENMPVWLTNRSDINSIRKYARLAQNIGENKCTSKLIIEYCERIGIEAYPVRPSKRTMSKLKASDFRHYTRYTSQTSEHGRDAAMLVFGM